MTTSPTEWKQDAAQLFNMDLDENALCELRWFSLRPQYQDIPNNVATIFLLVLKNQLFRSGGGSIITQKFAYIQSLLHNPFMMPDLFDRIMTMFCQTQRWYFAMLRFVHRCKHRIAKVQVQSDLYLNPLYPTSRHTFPLLHEGHLYYFSLTDLVNMITTSITRSTNMFLMPVPCKNPYNNRPFRKHDLYNMYFHMQRVFVRVPALIELYFNHDFNVYRLKKYHENTLLHYVVKEEMQNMPITKKVSLFLEMEYSVMSMNNVYIDMVKRENIMRQMHPYLHLYMLCKYVTDPFLRGNYHDELKWKLEQFHRANPELFQVKRYVNRQTQDRRTDLFINNVPDLVEMPNTPVCPFHTTHLYDDAKYNSFIYRGYYNEHDTYPDECVAYQVLMNALDEQSVIYTDTDQRHRYEDESSEEDDENTIIQSVSSGESDNDDDEHY